VEVLAGLSCEVAEALAQEDCGIVEYLQC